MIITNVKDSPLKSKRFRAFLSDGYHIDFGLLGGSTYIDHKDERKRSAYLKRHNANKQEHYLISNTIPSPALFSASLLWGKSTSLKTNVNELNKMLESKYGIF
jgi:hypothetical protein